MVRTREQRIPLPDQQALSRPARRRRKRAVGWRRLVVSWRVIRPVEAETLLVLVLVIIAFLIRQPYLLRLPLFTDEIGEIRWALDIYEGSRLPLTAQVSYFGPLHHYILAGALWIFGPSILLPRLLVSIFGALTAGLTYLLGRELGGWRFGALGALLLATLPQHIVVNSHIAWENSTTPFYTTLCCWLLLRALRAYRALAVRVLGRHCAASWFPAWGRWLVAAGLVFGLALQTHVGTGVLLPPLAGAFAWGVWRTAREAPGGTNRDAWRALGSLLARPWPYLAGVAAVVAYSPVLIDNLRDGLLGFRKILGRNYAYVQQPTVENYFGNLRSLIFEVMRMISNPFRIPERPLHYLTSWQMTITTALCVVGLIVLARRRQPLPLLVLVSTALLMPRYLRAYGIDGDLYLFTGRYIAFLLPPLMVAVAAGALALVEWAIAAMSAVNARRVCAVGALALITLLVLYSLVPLRRYYTHESSINPDNASFLATVDFVQQTRTSETPVIIDDYLSKVDLRDGTDAKQVLDVLFTLDGIPHRVVTDPVAAIEQVTPAGGPVDQASAPLVVMMYDRCATLRGARLVQVSERYRLRELYEGSPSFYAVYRYDPAFPKESCYPP